MKTLRKGNFRACKLFHTRFLRALVIAIVCVSLKVSATWYKADDGTECPTRMSLYYHNKARRAEAAGMAMSIQGQAAIEQDNRQWARLNDLARRNPQAIRQIEAMYFSPQQRAMLDSMDRTLDTVLPRNGMYRNGMNMNNMYPPNVCPRVPNICPPRPNIYPPRPIFYPPPPNFYPPPPNFYPPPPNVGPGVPFN